ncbi:hypothetical protein AB0L20_14915, partial [Streptomyces albidoflavus]
TLTVLLAAAVFLVATDRLSGLLGGEDGDAAPAGGRVRRRAGACGRRGGVEKAAGGTPEGRARRSGRAQGESGTRGGPAGA